MHQAEFVIPRWKESHTMLMVLLFSKRDRKRVQEGQLPTLILNWR